MRLRHIPEERFAVLGQDPDIDRMEWRKQCFEVKPSEEKDEESDKEKDKEKDEEMGKEQGKEKSDYLSDKEKSTPKETTPPRPKDSEADKEIPPGFVPKPTTDLGSGSQNPKDFQTLKARESELPQKTRGDSQTLIDPLKLTPLSTIELGYESLEDVMPLSEYKFDQSCLAVVKRTPKHRNVLVSGFEKPTMEGFEESTLWDIFGPDVA